MHVQFRVFIFLSGICDLLLLSSLVKNKLRIEASFTNLPYMVIRVFLYLHRVFAALCVVHFKMGSVFKDFTALSRLIFAIIRLGIYFLVSLKRILCSNHIKT